MLRKVGRLFTIKTRLEAWLVIYAIALGAVERGRYYLETYPGYRAGYWRPPARASCSSPAAKLLDSVRPAAAGCCGRPLCRGATAAARSIGRNRPMLRRYHRSSESRISRRTD